MERAFKYEGLGNDFVILDRRASGEDIGPEVSRKLCDRRRGLGADGVLVLMPSALAAARMVVHNADGSLAEMCGNGLRCVVKHLAEEVGAGPGSIAIETGSGVLVSDFARGPRGVEDVEVDMGPARLVAPHLPSSASGRPMVGASVPGTPWHGTAVSMGNSHLVLLDAPLDAAACAGPELEALPGFAERTNVEFAERTADGARAVVWERGVGLTEACGTGASAVAVASVLAGWTTAGERMTVHLPGGALQLRVEPDLARVWMRGPARFVYAAEVPEALLR